MATPTLIDEQAPKAPVRAALGWLGGFVRKPWHPEEYPKRGAQLAAVAGSALSAVAALVWFLSTDQHDVGGMVILGLLAAIGSVLVLKVPSANIDVVCSDAFLLIALVHLSGPDVAGVVLIAAVGKLLLERRSWMASLLYAALTLNGCLLASAVVHALFPIGAPDQSAVTYLVAALVGYLGVALLRNLEVIVREVATNAAERLATLRRELMGAARVEATIVTVTVPLALLGALAFDRERWVACVVLVPFLVVRSTIARTNALGQIAELNRRDPLTGLLNRSGLAEHAGRLVAECAVRGEPCAVLLGDIDDFKRISDTHGHMTGDEALRLTGETIERVLSGEPAAAARYGGEEFVVVLAGAHEDAAARLAERLRMAVGLKLEQWNSSLSVGVAWVERGDLQGAIEHADQAMHHAKGDGKNCIYLWPASSEAPSRLRWSRGLAA